MSELRSRLQLIRSSWPCRPRVETERAEALAREEAEARGGAPEVKKILDVD